MDLPELTEIDRKILEQVAAGDVPDFGNPNVRKLIALGLIAELPSGNPISFITPRGQVWLTESRSLDASDSLFGAPPSTPGARARSV